MPASKSPKKISCVCPLAASIQFCNSSILFRVYCMGTAAGEKRRGIISLLLRLSDGWRRLEIYIALLLLVSCPIYCCLGAQGLTCSCHVELYIFIELFRMPAFSQIGPHINKAVKYI